MARRGGLAVSVGGNRWSARDVRVVLTDSYGEYDHPEIRMDLWHTEASDREDYRNVYVRISYQRHSPGRGFSEFRPTTPHGLTDTARPWSESYAERVELPGTDRGVELWQAEAFKIPTPDRVRLAVAAKIHAARRTFNLAHVHPDPVASAVAALEAIGCSVDRLYASGGALLSRLEARQRGVEFGATARWVEANRAAPVATSELEREAG